MAQASRVASRASSRLSGVGPPLRTALMKALRLVKEGLAEPLEEVGLASDRTGGRRFPASAGVAGIARPMSSVALDADDRSSTPRSRGATCASQ